MSSNPPSNPPAKSPANAPSKEPTPVSSTPNTSGKDKKAKIIKPLTHPLWEDTNVFRDQMPTTLAKRDGKFGKAGKKTLIEINSHAVQDWPNKTVFQYDVSCPNQLLTSLSKFECRFKSDQAQRSVV